MDMPVEGQDFLCRYAWTHSFEKRNVLQGFWQKDPDFTKYLARVLRYASHTMISLSLNVVEGERVIELPRLLHRLNLVSYHAASM